MTTSNVAELVATDFQGPHRTAVSYLMPSVFTRSCLTRVVYDDTNGRYAILVVFLGKYAGRGTLWYG